MVLIKADGLKTKADKAIRNSKLQYLQTRAARADKQIDNGQLLDGEIVFKEFFKDR